MKTYVSMIIVGTVLMLLSVVAGLMFSITPKANGAIPQRIPTPEYSCGIVTN